MVESDSKIPIESLLGTWTASRGGKAMFEMSLDKDKTLTRTYREGKKEEKVKGVYALDGNVLAMEPGLGGIMLAELTAPQGGTFEFRTVGAPKTDPTLKFTKR